MVHAATWLQQDIMDFRKINDLYGAKVGDNVLISLAKALKRYESTILPLALVALRLFIGKAGVINSSPY